ncbi:hypothetical protein E2C01_016306 [Portunus trituberculatus]|uniref:Uncharacterized protein n=1 Tax=Portunus trituberculatus TaxID=210409 RepID=A0A5B7DQ82_PORTR|nr:hypothetical protein [Portunus trituberculatus]
MSVAMRTDSRLPVTSMVDGEGVDCSSLALPPPPVHAHPPTNGIGMEAEVIERVSPSQVTPVSSDTLSSSPDTQPGKDPGNNPRPCPPQAAHRCTGAAHLGLAGGSGCHGVTPVAPVGTRRAHGSRGGVGQTSARVGGATRLASVLF